MVIVFLACSLFWGMYRLATRHTQWMKEYAALYGTPMIITYVQEHVAGHYVKPD